MTNNISEQVLKDILDKDYICSCPLHSNRKDREHIISKITLSLLIRSAIAETQRLTAQDIFKDLDILKELNKKKDRIKIEVRK